MYASRHSAITLHMHTVEISSLCVLFISIVLFSINTFYILVNIGYTVLVYHLLFSIPLSISFSLSVFCVSLSFSFYLFLSLCFLCLSFSLSALFLLTYYLSHTRVFTSFYPPFLFLFDPYPPPLFLSLPPFPQLPPSVPSSFILDLFYKTCVGLLMQCFFLCIFFSFCLYYTCIS